MTADQHIGALLKRISERDVLLRAFCDVRAKEALKEAAERESVPAERRGTLHGLGAAIKEIFDVRGCRCGWGSEIHADRIPDRDSVLVDTLQAAGAVILGTVTSTEYAMARAAATTNPHDVLRTPGASSSGSAAAVAASLADFAIGSQTIGSGIRPAAYCGIIGLKPTHGWTRLDGGMVLSEYLDHAVVFARSTEVVKRVYRTLASVPFSEAASCGTPPIQYGCSLPRTALLQPWFDDPIDGRLWTRIRDVAQRDLGAPSTPFEMPDTHRTAEEACLSTILSHDMWRAHHGDYERSRRLMSRPLMDWLERGRSVSERAYTEALSLRQELSDSFWGRFPETDVLMTLATTDLPPLREQGTGSRAPQRIWTLLGHPTLTFPIGWIDGLPIGAQLIARPNDEESLLRAASKLGAFQSSIA